MHDIVPPLLFAVFVWWFGTGLVFLLDGLPRRTFRISFAITSGLAVASLVVLAAGAADASPTGAYVAFTASVLIWGWNELAFYMGYVTGPRPLPLPPGQGMWHRFRFATAAILWHEIAIALSALAIFAVTRGQPNQIGLLTFAVLWSMRLSAKFNVFLGVRNLNEQLLPDALAYLGSYFTRRSMNALFPLSVTLSSLAAAWLFHIALRAGADDFTVTGFGLLAALMSLAVLEHWFLVLPLPIEQLWRWSLGHRADAVPAPTPKRTHTVTEAT